MTVFLVLLFVLLFVTAVFYYCRRERKSSLEVVASNPTAEPVEERPKRIILGESPSEPLLTIESLDSTVDFHKGSPLDCNRSPIARLGAMLQAAPSLLVAGENAGKHVMEVVINGDLLRAADGNGLRAFAVGAGGIKEHARLFEAGNLQNLINATALWQVASVLVAQKHLADISRNLDEIRETIQTVSKFLENQRRARIQSTFAYLEQAHHAIQAGELSSAVRNQLESCDRELLEIQQHVENDYWQSVRREIKARETFGTEELTEGIASKIDGLSELAEEASLCLKTRIAAWHVLSLYPGEPCLKAQRRQAIEESIKTFEALRDNRDPIKREIERVYSFWNRSSTLRERKSMLLTKVELSMIALEENSKQMEAAVERSSRRIESDATPTRLLLRFEDNNLVEARAAEFDRASGPGAGRHKRSIR